MSERDLALLFLGYYSNGGDPAILEQLASSGRRVARCSCDYPGCTGWQMAWPDDELEGGVFPVAELIAQ